MNRYDLWRYFGSLPEAPEISYTRNPESILSTQKSESASISALFSTALRFSRLDNLKELMEPDDWDQTGDGLLCRARLRLYRALTENPEAPEISLLDEASADFRRAADHLSSSYEALAGLVRIHALADGRKSARKQLRRLEYFRGRECAKAAAGAWLFLAEMSGTLPADHRRFLRKALVNLKRSGNETGTLLIRLHIRDKLEGVTAAVPRWVRLDKTGSPEARIHLLQRTITNRMQPVSDAERESLLGDIAAYKKYRPSDPRAFVAEGDLLMPVDPESAVMAWRAALVLDDCHAEAWKRLGDYYKESWRKGVDEYPSAWLEAAGDAYLRAVTLEPLNPSYRLALGITERDSGRPARAIGTLLGGMALTPDDQAFRRSLAVSWTDLGYTSELSSGARSAAAGRARKEWSRLVEKGAGHPYDMMGLLRSIAVEIAEEPGKAEELGGRIDPLAKELIRSYPEGDRSDFIDLAEDLLRAGYQETAALFLDCSTPTESDRPRMLAVRAAMQESDHPDDSVNLYMAAAAAGGVSPTDKIQWLIRASDTAGASGNSEQAARILRTALNDNPGNRALLAKLTDMLLNDNSPEEASELYRRAVNLRSRDTSLLEDAVWFLRGAGKPELAESLILVAVEDRPDDSRLWNQLGVHYMEVGWNEETEQPDPGILEKAISCYRRAMALEPENPVHLGNLGDALRQAGNRAEARDLLNRAVENGSDSDDDSFALNALARLEDEHSYSPENGDSSGTDWENAGIHYGQAADIGAGNVDYQRDYAWWLYRERRLEESIAYYRRAAALDPSDESLPYGESVCSLELGDEEAALAALEKALNINPENPVMQADKADILGAFGRTEDAERLYQTLMVKTGGELWIRERYAEFLEQLASEGDNQPEIMSISPDGPGFSDIHMLIAGYFLRTPYDSRLRVCRAWEHALKIEPENKKALAGYGCALMDIGDISNAKKFLSSSAVHTGEPRVQEVRWRLGMLELAEAVDNNSADMWNRSKYHLNAAAESVPLDGLYQSGIGLWHYFRGDWEAALEAFRQASDRKPGEAVYAANTGICAYASGLFDESTAWLRRAISLRDTEPAWQNALGLSLMASGHPEKAIEAFRSACLEDPDNDIYTANLTLAHQSLHVPEGPLQ